MITSMMLAKVDGRPMPFSSSALTRDASVYRGFGLVAWPLGSTSCRASTSPTASCGSDCSSALSVSPRFSSRPSSYASRNPLKVYTVPDAVNDAVFHSRPVAADVSASRVTVVVSYLASDIWEAIVRFQMRSYRRSSSRSRADATSAGVRKVSPDGRMAS